MTFRPLPHPARCPAPHAPRVPRIFGCRLTPWACCPPPNDDTPANRTTTCPTSASSPAPGGAPTQSRRAPNHLAALCRPARATRACPSAWCVRSRSGRGRGPSSEPDRAGRSPRSGVGCVPQVRRSGTGRCGARHHGRERPGSGICGCRPAHGSDHHYPRPTRCGSEGSLGVPARPTYRPAAATATPSAGPLVARRHGAPVVPSPAGGTRSGNVDAR